MIDDPVCLIDVGPTVLDYAGLVTIPGTAGRSLGAQIGGARVSDRVVALVRFNNVTICKGDYRLIRHEDGSTQLFDLSKNPWTLRDLGPDHPAHATLLADLREHSATCGLTLPVLPSRV